MADVSPPPFARAGAARYGVIGDPVAHSLSPAIFQWLERQGRFSGGYEAWAVGPDSLQAAVEAVRAGRLLGLSVTLPHKEAVLGRVDVADGVAQATGAVNCLMRSRSGQVLGFNTDVAGVERALGGHGVALRGVRAVVLGAGGAARAALYALLASGASSVAVANRTLGRAERLVEAADLNAKGAGSRVHALALSSSGLAGAISAADVLINATRVGLGAPDDSPWPSGAGLHPGLTVLDMVYRPLTTGLLRAATEAGARTVDGLWMLVHQALEQLRLWTGYEAEGALPERLYHHLRKELT